MIYSIVRIIYFAFQNFFRNVWLAAATLTVLIITLVLVNVVISINAIKTATLEGVESRVDIALDFKPSIGEAEVVETRRDLLADKHVKDIRLVTPAENLDRFKERYPEIGERVIPILDGNPLGYSLIVRARSLEDYGELLSSFESNEELALQLDSTRFNDYRSITSKASAISDKINTGAVALAGVFLVVALIIVFNTIRVSIYTHREEIAIMRLVGAGTSFIRMPFIIESVLYAVIAVAVTGGIVFGLITFADPALARFFGDFATISLLSYYRVYGLGLFGTQLASAILINTISTAIAMRRYL